MKRFRFPMNLQLFAEKSATVDGETFTIEDDDPTSYATTDGYYEADEEGINISDDEGMTADDEETEEPELEEIHDDSESEEEQEEAQVTKEKGKNSTANAVISERRKWQERVKQLEREAELAKKIMKASGVSDVESLERQLDALTTQRYVDQGYDEHTAQMLVQQQRKIETMERDLRRQKFDVEVEALRKDPFYADIEDWREELEPIAERTGQSLKDAYMMIRGRDRMKEYEREVEQRLIANRTKKSKAKVDTSSGGGAMKKSTGPKLTPEQMQMAKMAGMTPEEYYKYMKK